MEYQIKDVCKIVGIKMSQGQYWTRLGVVEADITGPTTQGKARLFSPMNLFEFSVVQELTKRGIEAIDTKKVLEKIRESFPSFMDQRPKYELITFRTMADPLLVYFGKAFFIGSLLDIETKGVRHVWLGEPPPPQFLKDFSVRGFGGKVSVILHYYPSALIMNLETLKLDLIKRLGKEG